MRTQALQFKAGARSMKATRLALMGGVVWLAGCGGGGGDGGLLAGGGNGVSVSTLSAAPLRYGRATTISVQGAGLDKGITLDPGNVCTNLTTLAGGSDSQQNYTCVLGALGEFNMRVRDSSGKQLATLLVNVPVPQVTLINSKGTMVIELDVAAAKAAVDNFLSYVNGSAGFYNNTIINRADAGVGLFAGGFTQASAAVTPVLKANATAAVDLPGSNGLSNLRGTVAMLRDPDGATTVRSRFFINLKDNPEFDFVSDAQPGRPVFGRIVTGLTVADDIGAVPVNAFFNVPVTPLPFTAISQTR